MGKLLLCSHGLASAPYYIEPMALNVYSLEELCCYLKQNIDLVDPSFMEEELIRWIDGELKLPALAGKLEKLKDSGRLIDFIGALMAGCSYCTKEETVRIQEALADFENKSEAECRKIRADRLLSKKRYRASMLEYRKLLAGSETEGLFAGNIYHNLGTAYAGLFLFEEAAKCYEAAYEKNQNPLSLKQKELAIRFAKGRFPQSEKEYGDEKQAARGELEQWKQAYIRSCK